MARITVVQAARKAGLKCEKCRELIPVGQPYRHWAFRYGGKHVRCLKESCSPNPWELVSNAKLASLMEAANDVSLAQSSETPSEAAGYLEAAVSLVQGVAEEMEEAVSSWQDGNLANAERTSLWEEGAYNLSDWVTSAEGWASDLQVITEADQHGVAFLDYQDDYCEEDEACREYRDEFEGLISSIEEVPDIDLG